MSDSKDPSEQRKFERVPAKLTISYQLLEEGGPSAAPFSAVELSPASLRIHEAITKDISVGGFALVGERPFPVGGKVEVTFHLPWFKEGLKLMAEVVRTEPFTESQRTLHRGGIRILFIDPEALGYIEKHIHLLKKIQDELARGLRELKRA